RRGLDGGGYELVLGGREALRGARPGPLGLDLAILRGRRGDKTVDQALRCRRDLVYRADEGRLVRLRRLREAGDLPDVLERSVPDFFMGRGRLVVEERVDVSAHARNRRRAGSV